MSLLALMSPFSDVSGSHPNLQTVIVEIEVGDNLARLVTHPSLEFRYYELLNSTPDSTAEIVTRATTCVTRLYPRLSQPGTVLRTELISPVGKGGRGGHALSSTVQKYLSKVTARTEIQVPPSSLLCLRSHPRVSFSAGRISPPRE